MTKDAVKYIKSIVNNYRECYCGPARDNLTATIQQNKDDAKAHDTIQTMNGCECGTDRLSILIRLLSRLLRQHQG